MEFVPGPIIRDRMPPAFDTPEARRLVVDELVDTLVDIHAAAVEGAPPSGRSAIRAATWSGRSDVGRSSGNTTRRERCPPSMRLEHGSVRISRKHGKPHSSTGITSWITPSISRLPVRLAVIVDWEMSTLGDPLADLGLLCATYLERGEEPDPVLGFSPATSAEGAPTRQEIVARYRERSGRDVGELRWYEVLAIWKIAILLEGSYKRIHRGNHERQLLRATAGRCSPGGRHGPGPH